MASIDAVFHKVMSEGGNAAMIVVSNQPDGLVTYTAANLYRISDSAIQGNGSMLFSDRLLDYPDPGGGPVQLENRFNHLASQGLQITLTSPGNGAYELELNLPSPFNRDFHSPLTVYGDSAYGSTSAIGNTEHVDSATYLITLQYSAGIK